LFYFTTRCSSVLLQPRVVCYELVFFFDRSAPSELFPLSLHDALPIFPRAAPDSGASRRPGRARCPCCRRLRCAGSSPGSARRGTDRKSTRLNSSHVEISYAVFGLKKKKIHTADSPTGI